MSINYSPFNYNSLYQLNQPDNKSYISEIRKYKNTRSKIPIKPVYHNYNSISKIKNINNSLDDENKIFYNNENNYKLKSYEISNTNANTNYSNSKIKNYRFNSFGHLSLDKSKPEMNIMINNGIIKNIIVNKNCKNKIPIKINRIQNKETHHNNFYNNVNKIKEKIYNDYNRTFQNVNQKIIIRKYNENLNSNSETKNIKTFEYKSFNGKKLIKNNNNNNKIKQIPIGNINNYYSQKRNSYGYDINIYNNNLNKNNKNSLINLNNLNITNKNILNQNKKIKKYKSDNFFSKTNIYEIRNSEIKNNTLLFPYQYNNLTKKLEINNNKNYKNMNCTPINKHQSFNKNNLLNNNKFYNFTENNIYKTNLISSSTSSDFSNELSALAEDIINIQKDNKRKNNDKVKKNYNLKEITIKSNKQLINNNIINKNLQKDFNTPNDNKNKINDSTEENFDLIDQIINTANLEEKNKMNRHIIFDLEKNEYINYKAKEKVVKNDKKMEYYFTLLKSSIKLNPIIKTFEKKEIKINRNYILNENLEEYEMLGDLYNIFYLKDIDDLDKKLKNNIDNLIK